MVYGVQTKICWFHCRIFALQFECIQNKFRAARWRWSENIYLFILCYVNFIHIKVVKSFSSCIIKFKGFENIYHSVFRRAFSDKPRFYNNVYSIWYFHSATGNALDSFAKQTEANNGLFNAKIAFVALRWPLLTFGQIVKIRKLLSWLFLGLRWIIISPKDLKLGDRTCYGVWLW